MLESRNASLSYGGDELVQATVGSVSGHAEGSVDGLPLHGVAGTGQGEGLKVQAERADIYGAEHLVVESRNLSSGSYLTVGALLDGVADVVEFVQGRGEVGVLDVRAVLGDGVARLLVREHAADAETGKRKLFIVDCLRNAGM